MSSDPLYELVELALDKFQIEYAKAEHDQESYYAKDLSDALAGTASAALFGSLLLLLLVNGLVLLYNWLLLVGHCFHVVLLTLFLVEAGVAIVLGG